MKRRGFTLVEVLVAIVILSFSLVALFRLISQGLDSMNRVNSYQGLLVVMSNIVEDLDRIQNLEAEKQGQGRSGPLSYTWQAEQVAPLEPMSLRMAAVGMLRVGLYRITVRVRRDDDLNARPLREFSFLKTGWVRAGA